MTDGDRTVLVAMPPTRRRTDVVAALEDAGYVTETADDGLSAVDDVRDANAILVGGYPPRILSTVVEASTRPGFARPTVLVEPATDPIETPDSRHEAPAEDPGVRLDETVGTTVPPSSSVDQIVDATATAVRRGEYERQVREFSAAAAEAAVEEDTTGQLTGRVTELAAEARTFQREFSTRDWVVAFRAVASEATDAPDARTSRNRTS